VILRQFVSCIFSRTLEVSHSPVNDQISVVDSGMDKTLRVNGITQSGGYVEKLLRKSVAVLADAHKEDVRNILLLGVGGGTILPLLQTQYPSARIDAVDRDPEILRLGRKYFGLNTYQKISFLVADAREYVLHPGAQLKYGLVIVDLYIGNDVPVFATQAPFLRNVKNTVRDNGMMMMNYFSFRNQPEKSKILQNRLSEIYSHVAEKHILKNIFYYCS
jgi:spermidine synthase